VGLILEIIRNANLQLDVDKCEFHKTEMLYLGFIISTEGICMDPKKIETIVNWEALSNVKDVRAFLGFANFYKRFIQDFSRLVAPMVILTRKDAKFDFNKICRV
jgi:hypothetical protein